MEVNQILQGNNKLPRELNSESWADKSALISLFKNTIAETMMNKFNSDGGDGGHDDEGHGDGEDHNAHHKAQLAAEILIFAILITYLSIGSFMEIKMYKWGHETGVIILFGIAISFSFYAVNGKDTEFLKWNNDIFFQILLPLIIFTTGYNIRRKKFFSNIVNISKFGLVGTVLTFIILSLLTWGFFEMFDGGVEKCMLKPDLDLENRCTTWYLDIYSVCYMCAILTGSDIIAFVTLVKFEEYPSLFSIVLGEGLYNDVIVIILYVTMQ